MFPLKILNQQLGKKLDLLIEDTVLQEEHFMNVETPQEILNENKKNIKRNAFFADPDTILRNKQHLLPEMESFNTLGTIHSIIHGR